MPNVAVSATKKRTVAYRDAKGQTKSAKVLSAGSGSGMKIKLGSIAGGTNGVKDNVAVATAKTDTAKYFNRRGPA